MELRSLNTHTHPDPRSFYLHIPFCKRRCFYCDFAITTGGEHLKQEYISAICQEIALTAKQFPPSSPLQTIFFGGGTPSLLSASQLEQIMNTIANHFAIAPHAEISLEANPGTLSLESLQGYYSLGVNRISLGVQAFQEHLLEHCGRGHGLAEIYESVALIEQVGFRNFSLDLISGLPHQTLDDWRFSLTEAIALAPTHLSIYDLTIETGTAFGKRYQTGDQPLPSEHCTVEMYRFAHDFLPTHGYTHYEISNYAQTGYQAQHNLTYWHNRPFYGVGMGATSYLQRYRIDRPRKMREYLEAIALWHQTGVGFTAPLISDAEALMDTLMQGLRLAEGISLQYLQNDYGKELCDRALDCLKAYESRQWIEFSPSLSSSATDIQIKLTIPEGWLFSNIIIADLYDCLL